MNETLYGFIQRTLIRPEYELHKASLKFERELWVTGGYSYFEPSYVYSVPYKLSKVIK